MLACDFHEELLEYPLIVQPKIDGVHLLNRDGQVLARTLKKFANDNLQKLFGGAFLSGICGEVIFSTDKSAENLCRKTTSSVNTIDGTDDFTLVAFDFIPDESSESVCYTYRYDALKKLLAHFEGRIEVVESVTVNSHEELLEFEQQCLEKGYEGVIVRDPSESYKRGRCGKTHMGCWRVKRMIEEEIFVTSIVEGKSNQNEAKINELGRSSRSTHKDNMIPNGMVGSIVGTLVKDVVDPSSGKILFEKDLEIKVSAGEMTETMRKYYFKNQNEIVGKHVKFKMFPKGVKDKPRFPVFVTIRSDVDVL